MSELNIDSTEEETGISWPLMTNAPLMIALACSLLLLALFVAALRADGQTGSARDMSFGSISGRVIVPAEPHKKMAGVRVLVRRVHAGVANFYFDRISSADGSFEFKYLLPGRYTVEVDPRTVPDAQFPVVPKTVIIDVTSERSSYAEIAIERNTLLTQSTGSVERASDRKHR